MLMGLILWFQLLILWKFYEKKGGEQVGGANDYR